MRLSFHDEHDSSITELWL